MLKAGRKIAYAIVVSAFVMLPYFGHASLEEKGIKIGNTVGASIGFFLSSIGSTLDQSVLALRSSLSEAGDAVENVASSMYVPVRSYLAKAGHAAKRHHSMVRQAKNHLMSRLSSVAFQAKEGALALLPSHNPSPPPIHNPLNPPYLNGEEQQQNPPLRLRGARGVTETQPSSPLTIIERIIVRESSNDKAQITNQAQNPNTLTPSSFGFENRLSNLITNVADLTSRLDEKGGSGNNGLSLTSLYNMIAQYNGPINLDSKNELT